ncbi:histone deacetylase [Kribbella sp. NBC_00709]|uniref:histone deacetylase n=1 Tax=Kribbella sp. NBC_00709 TaxID=2975972 RepID=UPI002E2B9FD6|nr:histone deacetylase [Kribbella sp. NBC_00709]
MESIWYIAYGSNLALERFTCYISGGRPRGGARVYPGCRNQDPPQKSAAITMPGGLVFAGASKVWGGGSAFYNPSAPTQVAGRAYLLTPDQLADVAAQEMWRDPGGPFALELAALLPDVATIHTLGPGRYETVVRLGEHDDLPMYTVTHAAVADLTPVAPTASYLHWIVTGLAESHGWQTSQIVEYLHAAAGVPSVWTVDSLTDLFSG